ncbi:MAG: MFS transporter [Solirubrobacterales bacterium]|nr:MFS transporter [Solirubrobacterales bacterium]MBV9334568.1 MFS transporter [Solirubrobacterales bacterium]MBV9916934.1 MFS transporter [Solirubrobacterales bacterium]
MESHAVSPPVPRKTWTLVLAGLAAFMTALDTLVVTTALPVLRADLHASLGSLEWTVNAYNLAFACLLLTGAALGDRFGRRRMFCIGLFVFTAASAASALAPSAQALIATRALQGAGAAIVTPLTLTLISEAFPVAKRGAAIGLWGGIVGLAVAGGPVVGGAVVSGIDWHWMFWLNVPIGLALIPTAARKLTESRGPRPQLDLPGLVVAAGGVLGLTWGMIRANTSGWTSPEVISALVAGVVLVATFIAWERRARQPMVSPALFASRTFTAANGVSFFMYAGLFGALFLMSQLLQTGLGYSPLQAGIRLLPWTLPPMFIAPLVGTLAERYGNRLFMVTGMALQAAGFAWVASIATPGVDYLQLGAACTVAGIGTSFCFPTVAAAIMTSVPIQEAGVASGANSAIRELGGVIGVAVLASVFIHHGGYHSPQAFIHGFTPAVWVAVALSAIGIIAASLTAGRRHAPAANSQVVVAEPQAVTA